MEFKVSVIVPVYNAAEYLEYAVNSAVFFDEVLEILLIEDGSTDDSLRICQELALKYNKVFLFRHSGGINKGEAASRNFGIKLVKGKYIAFLDADDWYFPNRFKKDVEMIKNNLNVKVVYNFSTINYPNGIVIPYGEGTDFFNEYKEFSNFDSYQYVIEHDLVLGHVNANTLHLDVFENGDFFDERLKVHTDTEFWWRLNRKYKFYASELEKPVSAARRHDHNTIYKKSVQTKTIMLLVWMDNIGIKNLYKFEKKAVIYHLARAISNPIKNDLLRRSALHGFQCVANAIRPIFILVFYRWGMRKYKLFKD
ncbi:glycosyltransferase family 2 protein [Algoriphagus sp. NG3]|uniref:glycosyltransferase family 2 protein n=1 Tax=Algoriphagus sp. NG3 TaxID=3097546 RepID=UPI002A830F10|nr:glycosyltransferase family 2 protein [Algoriphagus sp. NG3]WPR77401.1 glycosyltransferase family 2 protein [Algoriphagus sp. NG3]